MVGQQAWSGEISCEATCIVKDLMTVIAGLFTYGLFLALHPYLFGVAVIA